MSHLGPLPLKLGGQKRLVETNPLWHYSETALLRMRQAFAEPTEARQEAAREAMRDLMAHLADNVPL